MPSDLAPAALRERLLAVVRRIPCGWVATYGEVAAAAGAPRAAREVGRALAALPHDTDVPWWRVVNRLGEISPRAGDGPTLQEARLRTEQVEFDPRGRVDLDRFRWEEHLD